MFLIPGASFDSSSMGGTRHFRFMGSPFYAQALELEAEERSIRAECILLGPFSSEDSATKKKRQSCMERLQKNDAEWMKLESSLFKWKAKKAREDDPMQKSLQSVISNDNFVGDELVKGYPRFCGDENDLSGRLNIFWGTPYIARAKELLADEMDIEAKLQELPCPNWGMGGVNDPDEETRKKLRDKRSKVEADFMRLQRDMLRWKASQIRKQDKMQKGVGERVEDVIDELEKSIGWIDNMGLEVLSKRNDDGKNSGGRKYNSDEEHWRYLPKRGGNPDYHFDGPEPEVGHAEGTTRRKFPVHYLGKEIGHITYHPEIKGSSKKEAKFGVRSLAGNINYYKTKEDAAQAVRRHWWDKTQKERVGYHPPAKERLHAPKKLGHNQKVSHRHEKKRYEAGFKAHAGKIKDKAARKTEKRLSTNKSLVDPIFELDNVLGMWKSVDSFDLEKARKARFTKTKTMKPPRPRKPPKMKQPKEPKPPKPPSTAQRVGRSMHLGSKVGGHIADQSGVGGLHLMGMAAGGALRGLARRFGKK